MKRALPLSGAMLALTSSLALGQGYISLAWNDCAQPTGIGFTNINPTCTSNVGANILVASFSAPVDMPQFNGHAGVVDLQVAGATLDPWWHVESGGCRAGRLTGSFDFTASALTCADVWAGGAAGGINVGTVGPNRLRVRTVCAVPGVAPIVADGTEYYVFKLNIANAQTVGTGSCAGCMDAACVVFNSLLLTQPAGVGDYTLTYGPMQYVTWRGGAVLGGCPLITPTRSSTWGSVKALYR